MTTVLLFCYCAIFGAIFLSLIRLYLGPSTLDRLLAFDAIALSAAALLIIFSVQSSSEYFIEVLLVFSLLGYTTILGYLDYLGHVTSQRVKGPGTGSDDME